MAANVPVPPGFDDLATHDQIEYVQSLWDRIAAHPEQVPVPEWHLRELRKRLADPQDSPAHGRLWNEVRADIEDKLKRPLSLSLHAPAHRSASRTKGDR